MFVLNFTHMVYHHHYFYYLLFSLCASYISIDIKMTHKKKTHAELSGLYTEMLMEKR